MDLISVAYKYYCLVDGSPTRGVDRWFTTICTASLIKGSNPQFHLLGLSCKGCFSGCATHGVFIYEKPCPSQQKVERRGVKRQGIPALPAAEQATEAGVAACGSRGLCVFKPRNCSGAFVNCLEKSGQAFQKSPRPALAAFVPNNKHELQ